MALTYAQIDRLVVKRGLTLTDLIDYVIQKNGIIGVGKFSLADDLAEYIKSHKGYKPTGAK